MRIAVVNNFFPPRVGGSAHLSDALARKYAAAGHEVLVLTAAYQDAPQEEVRDGVRIHRLPAWMIPETRLSVSFDIAFTTRPSLPRAVSRLLGGFRPDVIHQHGQFFDLTWATGAWAARNDVPTLLSIHTRLENPAALYRTVFGMLDRVMVRPAMRVHRPELVVMDVLMQEYIRTRYAGAYRGLEPIPVGVDPTWVRGGDGARIRDRLDLGDAPVVLSLGHVIPVRDRLQLIEGLPHLLDRHPHAKVVVAGHVYYDAFLRRARELGVAHAVLAIGRVPKAEVPDHLAAATVECHEQGYGLGTASLEAMAAGVPVIGAVRADNFPGFDLLDGQNIYLVPEGDGQALGRRLADVLDDPEQARRVGAAGAELVEEHLTIDRVAARHLEVLGRMVTSRD